MNREPFWKVGQVGHGETGTAAELEASSASRSYARRGAGDEQSIRFYERVRIRITMADGVETFACECAAIRGGSPPAPTAAGASRRAPGGGRWGLPRRSRGS